MSCSHGASDSIFQLLEIFKQYRTDANLKSSQCSTTIQAQFESSLPQQFSFSRQQLPNSMFGLHSSLERVSKPTKPQQSPRQHIHFQSIRQQSSRQQSLSPDSIFSRLYEEDRVLRQKRERLFAQGKRFVEAKQVKECTFKPNTDVKTDSHRHIKDEDGEAFYRKNVEWQEKREKEIKLRQCDRTSKEQKQLTFIPKINRYRGDKQNTYREESSYRGEKTIRSRQTSYLQQYHRNSRQLQESSINDPVRSVCNMKKGYFSYAR